MQILLCSTVYLHTRTTPSIYYCNSTTVSYHYHFHIFFFTLFFSPSDASSPSGKEGKPVENGVLVNDAPGKLMHRFVVLFLFFLFFFFSQFLVLAVTCEQTVTWCLWHLLEGNVLRQVQKPEGGKSVAAPWLQVL